MNRGFTLVETLIGIAIFVMVVTSVYQSYGGLSASISASKIKILATDLANEQFEIMRNLPYADVGLVGGIPVGKLLPTQEVLRDNVAFTVTTTVRNIDDPFDGTIGGVPNDLSPADYKLVEVEVTCEICVNFQPVIFSGRAAPKNLETASENGTLIVQVFDANGEPVVGADVEINNTLLDPDISIDDVTNNQGLLQIVDAPPSNSSYQITVTKDGYSVDRTYTTDLSNPTPTKPHATVALQQLTQISFAIDLTSSVDVRSVDAFCSPVNNFPFTLTSSKLIGVLPDLPKHVLNYSTGLSGVNLTDIEWDVYGLSTDSISYDIIGTSPLIPLSVTSGSDTDLDIFVREDNPITLLVSVTDSVTGNALDGVSVSLSGVSPSTRVTGTLTGFDTDTYGASSLYESPVFNLGGGTTIQEFTMEPPYGEIGFQFAGNNDGATWNFAGPDGTPNTYFDSSPVDLSLVYSNITYFKYLASTTAEYIPDDVGISLTHTGGCAPSGQVAWGGLTSGLYDITVSKAGYTEYVDQVNIDLSDTWKLFSVSLNPEI